MTPEGIFREIELAAIRKGKVQFEPNGNFNYEEVDGWHNISFENRSAINGSNFGIGNSGINLSAHNLKMDENSIVLLQNFGDNTVGDLNIKVENKIEITSNFGKDGDLNTGVFTQQLGEGGGGNINVDVSKIKVDGGGKIETYNYSSVDGSDVNINADHIQVNQIKTLFNGSNIGTYTLGEGKGGQLNIKADEIEAIDGGTLVTITLGDGDGGNANFEVSDLKLAKVSEPTEVFLSSFAGTTSFSDGKAGDVFVSAKRIFMVDGGGIISITFDLGDSGDVFVNAELIETKGPNIELDPFSIRDQIENTFFFSGSISSTASSFREDVSIAQVAGNVGNVFVNAKEIRLSDVGTITAGNLGSGNGGNVFINAENIDLENFSVISGAAADDGGNVTINTNSLSLDQSSILASSEGTNSTGNSGNVLINVSDRLLLRNESAIRANAVGGEAGNILISAGGLLQDATSEITATSELGVDGEVLIIVPDDSLNQYFSESEPKKISSSEEWITSCFDGRGKQVQVGRFIIRPIKDGLPKNPDDPILDFPWFGLESESLEDDSEQLEKKKTPRSANTIIKTADGVSAVHLSSEMIQKMCENHQAQYLIINPPNRPNGSSNSSGTLTSGWAE